MTTAAYACPCHSLERDDDMADDAIQYLLTPDFIHLSLHDSTIISLWKFLVPTNHFTSLHHNSIVLLYLYGDLDNIIGPESGSKEVPIEPQANPVYEYRKPMNMKKNLSYELSYRINETVRAVKIYHCCNDFPTQNA